MAKHHQIELFHAQNIADKQYVEEAVKQAVLVSGAALMDLQVNEKDNRVSCMALVEGGNLTMQTWPESKYVSVNYFTRDESVKPYEAFASL